MKPEQFDVHELSIMLAAFDMALKDISKYERDAKRKKDKDRRKMCMVMFLQICKIRNKAERLLDSAPALVGIEGGKK
jgi:hypothetical protein